MATFVLDLSPLGPNGELTQAQLDMGQAFMDATAEFHNKEISKLMEEKGLSLNCAMDVSYLRTRSRHTPELEERLIREYAEGKQINICDWPPEPELHADLLKNARSV